MSTSLPVEQNSPIESGPSALEAMSRVRFDACVARTGRVAADALVRVSVLTAGSGIVIG